MTSTLAWPQFGQVNFDSRTTVLIGTPDGAGSVARISRGITTRCAVMTISEVLIERGLTCEFAAVMVEMVGIIALQAAIADASQ